MKRIPVFFIGDTDRSGGSCGLREADGTVGETTSAR